MLPVQQQVIDLGLRIFPCRGKKPLCHWKEEAASRPIRTESYGIVCDRIAVIDADTREKAVEIFQTRPRTPWMVKTPRGGIHFYYRGSDDLTIGQYDQWDLRAGGNGYVIGPGSVVRGKVYELIGKITLDLPEFDPSWIPDRTRVPVDSQRAEIKHAAAYITKIHAVSGQGGHKATFRAACKLRDAGMSEAEALAAMVEWNQTNAEPPWSVKELLHKVRDAYRKVVSNE